MTIKNSKTIVLFSVVLSLQVFAVNAQKLITPPIMQENWLQENEPFRIAGNLYYVGTYDLASYLIITPQGNILINTGLAQSVSMIKAHVEKLGFKFSDIKILLATHAHYDHVAGMSALKKMTGAKMMIQEKDAPVLEDGGNSDYSFGGKGSTFEPVKADGILHDHDTVKLGDMKIIVLHHPGHTKGACSFLFTVKDDQRSYEVLVANMPTILDTTKPGMQTYPDVVNDYGRTFDTMKKIKFDLWVASHASQFNMHEKHKTGQKYSPEVFADRQGYDTMLGDLVKAYQEKLCPK